MSNTLLTIAMITRESLRVLVNNIVFAARVNRSYDDAFAKTGAKIGSVLNVRKPVQYVWTTGQGLQLQDVTETSTPVTLTTQYQRAFTFTSADRALSIDDFSTRFVKPAVLNLANQIDWDGLQLYKTVWNAVGTPGTVPNTTTTYLDAGVKLDNNAAPVDEDRCVVFNPQMQATAVDTVKGLFNPQVQISDFTRKGMLAKNFLGFDFYMDQNVAVHTVGLQGGTPLANNATAQTGASIVTDGWTASTQVLNKGDIITFATGGLTSSSDAVLMVNPQNRQSVGQLQQFVVTSDVTSSGGGAATIPISPSITTSGAFQNVTQGVLDETPINVFGAASTQTPQAIALHRDAFTFATADLPMPDGVDMANRDSANYAGLSLRLIRAYDINTDRFPLRLDLLGGWAPLYPQLACRIAS